MPCINQKTGLLLEAAAKKTEMKGVENLMLCESQYCAAQEMHKIAVWQHDMIAYLFN